MAIWVGDDTRLLVQGITGKEGTFHALGCRDYGTKVVAGVTPGKGGESVEGMPVFDTVDEARARDRRQRLDDLRAAAVRRRRHHGGRRRRHRAGGLHHRGDPDARHGEGEGLPRTRGQRRGDDPAGAPHRPQLPRASSRRARRRSASCPGTSTSPGGVGVVSRSGTLTYEAVWQLTNLGLGQSTCVGIGGDPIIGTNFIDVLEPSPRTPTPRR